MAHVSGFAEFDWVELLEPVDDAPAGAQGGLLDFLDDGYVLVEVMDPPLLDMPVVCVQLSKLRKHERPPARA